MDQQQVEEVLLKRGGQSPAMRSIKQTRDTGEKLVFMYPMLLDAMLNKKYGNLIRDFMSTNFMSQIKSSNILNITADAISADMVSSTGGRSINPAEELVKSMQRLGGRPSESGEATAIAGAMQSQQQHFAVQQSKHEYQEKINQFREYIKDQIKHDPTYSDVRPVVSSITVENLLNIPLVIGTKSFKVHSIILYWILFIAVGLNLDLTKKNSFDVIKRTIRTIPSDKYLDLMYNVDPPRNMGTTPDSRALTKFVHDIQDGVDKAIKRFENLIDEQRYATEVGAGSVYSVSISQSIQDSSGLLNNLSRRASTLFASFLGNDITRLLQSITHVIIPPTEIDIARKLDNFNGKILSSVGDVYGSIAEKVNIHLKADDFEAGEAVLKSAEEMCKDNAQIEVDRIFTQIAKLRFSLKGDTGSEGNPAQELPEFTEDLIRHSATLNTFSKILADYMTELSGNNVAIGSILERFKYNTIYEEIREFFEGGDDPVVQFMTIRSNHPIAGPLPTVRGPHQPGVNPAQMPRPTHPVDDEMQDPSRRFSSLISNPNDPTPSKVTFSKQQAKFLDNMYQAIADITFFIYLYSFFSYFCEYLGEVRADVQAKRQDALDFPNYCLVLPSTVIEGLYAALAAKNFSDMIENEKIESPEHRRDVEKAQRELANLSPSPQNNERREELMSLISKAPRTELASYKITEAEVGRMLTALHKRIKVPNIIVINEKTSDVHIKWMYHNPGQFMKLNLSTLKNYVKHQLDVLPGF